MKFEVLSIFHQFVEIKKIVFFFVSYVMIGTYERLRKINEGRDLFYFIH